MPAQVADFLTNQHQVARRAFIHSAFTRDDFCFQFRRRIVEVDRDEALAVDCFKSLRMD